MADRRRLKENFAQAARKTRRSLTLSFATVCLLAGGCSIPEKQTYRDDMHQPAVSAPRQEHRDLLRPDSNVIDLFARNAPAPANDNLTREEQLRFYMDRMCFRVGDETGEEHKKIRAALQELQNMPLLGAPLVAYAVTNDVQFCTLPDMTAGVGAQYVPRIHVIMSSDAGGPEVMLLRIAHEIFHARQDGNDLLNYYYSWDVDSRVARNMTIEAAAVTAELLIAFEAKQNGNPKIWEHIQKRFSDGVYGDAVIYERIENSFAQAKAAGLSDIEAYGAAGRAAFERVFDVESWRNYYLNFELQSYITDITSGALDKTKHFTTDAFPPAKAAKAGMIGRGTDSFTATARRPSLTSMLSHNARMRWAYEAAELERYRRVYGADAPQTTKRAAEYAAGGNPYLALDLADILHQARAAALPAKGERKKFAYLYEYMDAAIQPPAETPAQKIRRFFSSGPNIS